MSKQSFNAYEREAILKAHNYKCPYTNKRIDESIFHIDHIIPECYHEKNDKLEGILDNLDLPKDFDLLGWENLLPCHPNANLRKSNDIIEEPHIRFYLNIAKNKKPDVIKNLERIKLRNNIARLSNLLEQILERGESKAHESTKIFNNFNVDPKKFFDDLKRLLFIDKEEAIEASTNNFDFLGELQEQLDRVDSSVVLELATLENMYLSHFNAKNINRHRILFSRFPDIESFHLYRNESEQYSILRGFGPFSIVVKNGYIDIDFNNLYYQPQINENFKHINLIYLPVKELIDLTVSTIENDEEIESFSITYDFRPTMNEIYFSFKTDVCNIDPNKFGCCSSGIYTVENDELISDTGMRLPPFRESSYLKIIVASYNIYRKILKYKAD